jgi:hypothetical protein
MHICTIVDSTMAKVTAMVFWLQTSKFLQKCLCVDNCGPSFRDSSHRCLNFQETKFLRHLVSSPSNVRLLTHHPHRVVYVQL